MIRTQHEIVTFHNDSKKVRLQLFKKQSKIFFWLGKENGEKKGDIDLTIAVCVGVFDFY